MLTIDPDTVCFIIAKARAFDVKVAQTDPHSGSNPPDDNEIDVLQDNAQDATYEELRGALASLNEDELLDLVALAWIGRGDFARAQWDEARNLAKSRHGTPTESYLLGMPLLGDFLETGLHELGYTVTYDITS